MEENAGQTREQVLAAVTMAGCDVTGDQLARWHRAGLIPKPEQRALGRGRGTVTIYPEGTIDQLIALCGVHSRHRNLSLAALELWWQGFDVDPDQIRRQLVKAAAAADADVPNLKHLGTAEGSSAGFGNLLNRRLGRARRERVEAAIRAAALDPSTVPASFTDIGLSVMPPSLDEMLTKAIPLLIRALAGASVVELVTKSSFEELCAARDEFKLLLEKWPLVMEPLAWLFGKRGVVFRVLAELPRFIGPSDLPDILCASLLIRRVVPEDVRTLVTQPFPRELREIAAFKAIYDDIPGAQSVVTPRAIRALMRNKEAAKRHMPKVRDFMTSHEVEVRKVVDPELLVPPETSSEQVESV